MGALRPDAAEYGSRAIANWCMECPTLSQIVPLFIGASCEMPGFARK